MNKFIRLRNSPDFLGLTDFFGVLFEALGSFFGFDFCPHSMIPVT